MNKSGHKKLLSFQNFTKLSDEALYEILEARNQPYIRKNMVNQDEISREEHLNFCRSLNDRQDCLYLRVSLDGKFIGVVDFTEIDNKTNKYVPGNYCLNDQETEKIWTYVCAETPFICIDRKLLYPKILVKKSNIKALMFNTMKLGCEVLSEDDEYYYLTNHWLSPQKRTLEQAKEELSYLYDMFDLNFDL